ncbi:Tetratricopeptide repeat protein [Legionella santicrucis]|uniref:Tetratricopeptide repeat protein n=1 Tax=Legionella santicrucis TaxID=45074 RepID=A0A0W0YTU8_9GAMM|nr:hypothetical protein [Legionella santicrucis]KTD60296.1 Tetratricopeptide repeat protein [Legionella santicrucis]
MDEEKRRNASQKIANAKKIERTLLKQEVIDDYQKRNFIKQQAIGEYQEGINLFLQISNKSVADIKAIVSAYYDLATLYFNSKDYANAGACYEAAINQLVQTSLDDDSYRNLTELYIDLADACYEMMHQVAGDQAMTNAIKAFGLIQYKTLEEHRIGDPVTHFREFHAYYEKKLSTKSYLKSANFINHEHLLGERQVERQQEQALFDQFESISLSEIQQFDRSLEKMLSQLSLSAEQPIFSPISLNKTPSDSAYRGMAMQFLNLAKSHIQNQQISDAITTYQQAIRTLNAIQLPNESDLQIIQSLLQQIEYLQKKPSSSHSHSVTSTYQAEQPSVSVTTQRMGFFDRRFRDSTNEPTPQFDSFNETSEEEEDENRMSL